VLGKLGGGGEELGRREFCGIGEWRKGEGSDWVGRERGLAYPFFLI
jgi:hypothetical protein